MKGLQDFQCPSPKFLSLEVNPVNLDGEFRKRRYRKRTPKRKRKPLVVDEALRLLRRSRYLLLRMKMEQNLIDAYSSEGWKGKSREKIRPENELRRARKKILNYKVGIRNTIHQIELQSCEGCIEDSVMLPDGSVHHEHIFCAKCKSREAFSDNDIILCDGACNRAFHQKCLHPPLEKIPPGDQGWVCSLCECKMEVLESVNAHFGTAFTIDSRWEDIFKEAEDSHDAGNSCLDPAHEWPSDDSDDADYDPEVNVKNHITLTNNGENRDDDVDDVDDVGFSSSESFCSSDDANMEFRGQSTDDDQDALCFRRQKRDVDYKKLYDEMFGKERQESEESDEDEDWGPRSRGQRQLKGLETKHGISDGQEPGKQGRKFTHRIPRETVEKLRGVFVKNKLPSKALREDLSAELGLSTDRVSQWFKNARYSALKNKKANSSPVSEENTKGKLAVANDDQTAKDAEEARHGKTQMLDQLERLCSLSDRISRLKTILKNCSEPAMAGQTVVYVPVVKLKEKMTRI